MINHIYKVTFKTGEEFLGGSISSPNWADCLNSGIMSLEVFLPYGDILKLTNYEKYNFYIGAIKPITGKDLYISHVYTLGSRDDYVNSYRITLISTNTGRHKVGDITVRMFPFGKEGMGRNPTNGWKSGI